MNKQLELICTAIIGKEDISKLDEVDIIWSFGKSNTPIRTSNNVAASNMNTLTVYSDSFIIPSLTVYDTDDSYHCQVLINSTPVKEDFTISLPSNACTYIVCIIIDYVLVYGTGYVIATILFYHIPFRCY